MEERRDLLGYLCCRDSNNGQRVRFLEEWGERELNHALAKPENRLLRQFVTIFHETLIRPINLCELELSQLNLEERFIHLGKTKNGELNLVPLSQNAFWVFNCVKFPAGRLDVTIFIFKCNYLDKD